MWPLASENVAKVVELVQLGCSEVLAELGKEVCQTRAGSAPDLSSANWPPLHNIRGELLAPGLDDGLAFAAKGWLTLGWPFARPAGWLALALALTPVVVRIIPAAIHDGA